MFFNEFQGKLPLIIVPSVFPPPSGCEELRTLISSDQLSQLLGALE